jgi:mannose-1-phosphate guanylyltransferase
VWGGAFLGVHVVGERLRPGLPAEGCLVGDVYLPALRRGAAVLRTFDVRSPWHDIGTLADYEAASWAWLERTGRSSFVGKGVRLSGGVRLGRCIVGDGAEILGEGELRRCIVWPGARVTVPRPPSVVTPWGTVALGEGRE